MGNMNNVTNAQLIKNIKSLSIALYIIDSKGPGNANLDMLESFDIKMAIRDALKTLEQAQRES